MMQVSVFAVLSLIVLVAVTQFKGVRGYWGERLIRLILAFLPREYRVFNDVRVYANGRKCQIDHLVVSPYGIFVIETKSYLGLTYGSSDDGKWCRRVLGKRYRTRNVLLHNRYHVDLLGYELRGIAGYREDWLKSIVVFCLGSRVRIEDKPSNVVMFYRLYGCIRGFREVIIPETALRKIMEMKNKRSGFRLRMISRIG